MEALESVDFFFWHINPLLRRLFETIIESCTEVGRCIAYDVLVDFENVLLGTDNDMNDVIERVSIEFLAK